MLAVVNRSRVLWRYRRIAFLLVAYDDCGIYRLGTEGAAVLARIDTCGCESGEGTLAVAMGFVNRSITL